jgi:ferredoxin
VPQAAESQNAFHVRLTRSGREFAVAPDQTILEVLQDHGITVKTSCRSGVCGRCITRVIGGIPDHRDWALTDEQKAAGDQIAICCSRSLTPVLILDL